MSGIFDQLGVNWRLLLTQGVNFFVLLIVLTVFVYRPLIKVVGQRRKRIELGLKGAEEAEKRLNAIEEVKTQKLAEADKSALGIISAAEDEAKKRSQDIVAESHQKADSVLKEAAAVAERRKAEELSGLAREAEAIIKAAIAKTVELDPKLIDEKLTRRAVELTKEQTA